jgi:hypothetical protein
MKSTKSSTSTRRSGGSVWIFSIRVGTVAILSFNNQAWISITIARHGELLDDCFRFRFRLRDAPSAFSNPPRPQIAPAPDPVQYPASEVRRTIQRT